MSGISILQGSYRVNFRDARDIKQNGQVLTFKTSVTCRGNSLNGLNACHRMLNPETYSGLENCISNPILIDYTPVENEWKTTAVKVYMQYFQGFEILQ